MNGRPLTTTKMSRLVLLILTLLLVVIWISPLTGDAKSSRHGPIEATAAPPPDVADATAPSPPALKRIVGTEGYWRIAQDEAGVWWFLSPDGRREFLNSVTTVQPYQRGRDVNGPHYISRDYAGGLSMDGDVDAWAKATLDRVLNSGFKGLGAWCHPAFHKLDVPLTRDLNVWTWMGPNNKRLYSPQWKAIAENAIKTQVELLRDNRNLVGYYIDNELDWGDSFVGPGTYFDHLPPDDPNRAEVIGVIRSIWTSIEAFNSDWPQTIADWDELQSWQRLPHENAKTYGRLFTGWLSHVAEDYFRTTTALIRQYDPNHLILGVRFNGYAPPEVVGASGGYTDAQSINCYVGDARLDPELFRMMNQRSGGQPIIVSEYSFHSLDGRSGNRNTFGFAAQVLDQRARADGYRLFTTRLARVPYIIGADWFQWADEPPSGRANDGEDVNFGIVDVDDRPYEQMVNAVRQTAPQLNPLHAGSAAEQSEENHQDIWRESFAAKPVMRVPYLRQPIALNGELSDWPAQCKLPGIRHSQTLGLERSTLPLPNVYLGWTNDGLYLGMEVFDNDIQGAPPSGWWWTRDNVEFWISTRPAEPDQNNFNVYSHQFFFVPVDFPRDTGIAGTTGRWHREGDAIADNLIPHPDVKQSVRLLPDRYVVELFIPGSALNGFDPANEPAMAFNVCVRNFQHAIAYFWSAPKEVMTQLRPNTWGQMYLEKPPADSTDDAPVASAQSR